jgi:hypothetical protein
MTTTGIIGLDPTGGTTLAGSTAARPPSLDGLVLGLVSNRKGEATAFLGALHDELRSLGAATAGSLLVEKDTVFSPPRPEDWDRLTAGVQVAVTGFGG